MPGGPEPGVQRTAGGLRAEYRERCLGRLTTPARPAPPQTTIITIDFAYQMPATLPTGYVDLTLVNSGAELHEAPFVLLNDGVSFAQFQSALLAQGLLVMRTLGTLEGGPNITPPGKSTEVVLNLPAGQYAVLAPIPAKDGVRQYLKGMVAPLMVSGASNVNQVQHPSPDRPILLRGFSITVPGTIKAGAQTWQVSNQGDQPYEFNLVQLAPGKTEQDVIAFYTAPAGPPPFVNLGGMASISPNITGWVKVNLVAGNYVALSLVIDKATGKPDYQLGMITSFTVA